MYLCRNPARESCIRPGDATIMIHVPSRGYPCSELPSPVKQEKKREHSGVRAEVWAARLSQADMNMKLPPT